jgi:hypothetical protein
LLVKPSNSFRRDFLHRGRGEKAADQRKEILSESLYIGHRYCFIFTLRGKTHNNLIQAGTRGGPIGDPAPPATKACGSRVSEEEIQEITFNHSKICMTAKEVIEIVRESKLWAPLTEKEKQEVIRYALKRTRSSIPEEDIGSTVGEVYLKLK